MFRIVEKTELAAGIFRMRVEAPRVAASALPGQFVIVRADEQGERVPLTVADYDRTAGTVTIVTQTIGVSTRKICALEAGDALADFAGPLTMRPTAQFSTEATHADQAHNIAILVAEKGHGTCCLCLFQWHFFRNDRQVCHDLAVNFILNRLQFCLAQWLRVIKIETQTFIRNQRTCLMHMLTQSHPQSAMQKMRG